MAAAHFKHKLDPLISAPKEPSFAEVIEGLKWVSYIFLRLVKKSESNGSDLPVCHVSDAPA